MMGEPAVAEVQLKLSPAPALERDVSDIEYINDYLAENERTELLKFLTCGSVDDGKSTLIGRLLYDSNKVYEDHLKALIRDSRRLGHDSDDLEFALLADGLKAEQEQGITIDVAYRYFATSSRKYIIADCPGHSQYTKNMATGASNCQLAVILIDAQNGVLDQTRRHSLIVDLLGIRQVVVAINKMDLVSYDKQIYERIRTEYLEFAEGLGFTQTSFVPVAAKFGENVVQRSTNMDWYTDDTIIELLERTPVTADQDFEQFSMTVQRVHHPSEDFRGYSGTITKGVVRPGDPILVLPSGHQTRVERIVTMDGDLEEGFAPQSITLTVSDQLSINRGDTLLSPSYSPSVSDTFLANVVWMANKPLTASKSYIFKMGARQVTGQVAEFIHRLDVNTQARESCDQLDGNEIGLVRIQLQRPVVYEAYADDKTMGSFIVIDRITNETVGAGMICDQIGADASGI